MSEELLLSVGIGVVGTTVGLVIGLALRSLILTIRRAPESRTAVQESPSPAEPPIPGPAEPGGVAADVKSTDSLPHRGTAAPIPLTPLQVLDVFAAGRLHGRYAITADTPLRGELFRDSGGRYFLSPEEDERGGGMGSLEVFGLDDPEVLARVPCEVEVTGVFDSTRGLEIETVSTRAHD